VCARARARVWQRQEARAKLELREVITTEMALDVVNLMRESMLDTLTDEFGGIDFGRTGGNSKKGEYICIHAVVRWTALHVCQYVIGQQLNVCENVIR